MVNASSEEGGICVNGMSYSDRGGENANSAVLTEVLPEDLGEDVLSGIELQRQMEREAFLITGGKGVPTRSVGEYVFGQKTEATVKPTVLPFAVEADIQKI